jgi:hypothetical protein
MISQGRCIWIFDASRQSEIGPVLMKHAGSLGHPELFSQLLEILKHLHEIGQDVCSLQNSARLSHRYTPPWHADGEQHQGGHRQIFPCKGMDNLNQITGRGRGVFTSTLSSAMSGKEFAATVSTLPMADQQTIRTSLVKSWGSAADEAPR